MSNNNMGVKKINLNDNIRKGNCKYCIREGLVGVDIIPTECIFAKHF